MGSIRKHRNGWRAEVCIDRKRASRVCRTKAEAENWVKATEKAGVAESRTFGDAVDRYRRTVTVRKPSKAREEQRLDRLQARLGKATPLESLTPDVLTAWRDNELDRVSAASVRREWSLLHHLLAVATQEWEWIPSNPLSRIKLPPKPSPRSRTWSDTDIATYLHCAGWPGDSLTARTGDCLLFALETAMRAGEICGIRAEHIYPKHVHLPMTKNGTARDVPLSSKARAMLDQYPDGFGITTTQLNSLFRKVRDRAGLTGLRFHDARRTALTKLSAKLDALELARVSGHKDLKVLLSTYYAVTVEDLAGKLD